MSRLITWTPTLADVGRIVRKPCEGTREEFDAFQFPKDEDTRIVSLWNYVLHSGELCWAFGADHKAVAIMGATPRDKNELQTWWAGHKDCEAVMRDLTVKMARLLDAEIGKWMRGRPQGMLHLMTSHRGARYEKWYGLIGFKWVEERNGFQLYERRAEHVLQQA